MQKVNILTVKAFPDVYQGDLMLNGNNVTVIEGTFDINGSILVEENATLNLRSALLTFVQTTNNQFNLTLQNLSNGNPRLVTYNSTIGSNADLRLILKGNSTADLNKVTIPGRVSCRAEDVSILSISNSSDVNTPFAESGSSAHIVIQNSTIYQWQNYGYNTAPEAQVYDSNIEYLTIGSSSIICEISDIYPGLVTYWSFIENCSVALSGGLGGAAPNVTLNNTQVSQWSLAFYGNSIVTIIDSILHSLLANDHPMIGESVVLINSTISSMSVYGQARIQIFWYLNVHIVDDINQDVPSANVTVTFQKGTLVESKFTGEDGWARSTLMEKIKNATGEYPVGIYTVEANYETYSNSTAVEMTGPQQITLTLDGFIIPEFPSFLIMPLFMIATLLAIILYRRKQGT